MQQSLKYSLTKTILYATLLFALNACDSSSTTNENNQNQADASTQTNSSKTLDFDSAVSSLKLGDTVAFKVYFSDTQTQDQNVSKDVVLEANPANLVEITQEASNIKIKGLAAGTVEIKASYQGVESKKSFDILAPNALSLSTTTMDVENAEQFNLQAMYQYANGDVLAVTDMIEWTSLTPELATVDQSGLVSILKSGALKIQAKVMDLTATFEVTIPCRYPKSTTGEWNNLLAVGSVIPPIFWEKAYSARLGMNLEGKLDLKEIYCGGNQGEYQSVQTINLILTAGWCPACPDYLRAVDALNPDLEINGGLLIYVDVQNDDYVPATTAFAAEHLNRLLGRTSGYYVGDKDSKPASAFFNDSPTIDAFPSAFVIRRSDMMIISSQGENRDAGMLPFIDMAQNPNQDWREIMPPPFENQCGDQADEASEPNNEPAQAAQINMMGDYMGGICSEGPDYYLIDLMGPWTATLTFDPSMADLDIYLLDPNNPDLMAPLASSESTDMIENLSGENQGLLAVFGFQNASAPYVLNIHQ